MGIPRINGKQESEYAEPRSPGFRKSISKDLLDIKI